MARWLHEDAEAMAYLQAGPTPNGKPRFYSCETIETAGIGFTGRDPVARKNEMRELLLQAGVDPECPGAVAILGFQVAYGSLTEEDSKFLKE